MGEVRPMGRTELLFAAGVGLIGVAVWWVLTWRYGAVGIARNDDWSFIRNAFLFRETGEIAVSGWAQMTLIAQLVLAAPVLWIFGDSVTALQLFVGVVAVVGLTSGYALLRRFLEPAWSALGMATLAVSAPFALLSVSFMTDIPAAALQLLALALAARASASREHFWPWIITASAIAVLAFSIREYALVAIGAIWLLVVLRRNGRRLMPLIAWSAGLTGAVITVLVWRSTQATIPDAPLGVYLEGVRYLPWWPLTLSWLLIPVLAVLNPSKVFAQAWRASRILSVALVLLVLVALGHTRLGFIGNYLSLSGGYAEVIRGKPTGVFPTYVTVPMTVLAVTGVVLLALVAVTVLSQARTKVVAFVRTGPSAVVLSAFFVALTTLALALAPIVAPVAIFDRYAIAALPVLAGLILWWAKKQDLLWPSHLHGIAAAGVAIVGVSTFILVTATAAVDGARWSLAATVAEDLGVDLGNIDGGFDFYSFQTDGEPLSELGAVRWTWWTAQLAQREVCATITYADYGADPRAAGPLATDKPIASLNVHSPLAPDRRIVAYAGPDSC